MRVEIARNVCILHFLLQTVNGKAGPFGTAPKAVHSSSFYSVTYFLISRRRPQPKRLNQYLCKMAQKTPYSARMCLLGGQNLKYPPGDENIGILVHDHMQCNKASIALINSDDVLII